MRSFWKLGILLSLLAGFVACGNVNNPDANDSTPTDNTIVNGTNTDGSQQALPIPSPSPEAGQWHLHNEPGKATELAKANEAYAKHLNVSVQEVESAWAKYLGTTPLSAVQDGKDFGKFLQFVRVTGGDEFAQHQKDSAQNNKKIHQSLDSFHHDATVADVSEILSELKVEKENAQWMKKRVLKVGEIYQVKVEDSDLTLEKFKKRTEDFAAEVTDDLNKTKDYPTEDYQKTVKKINQELQDLLQASTVALKDERVTCLSFTHQDNPPPENDGRRIEGQSFGAHETQNIHFVKVQENSDAQNDNADYPKKIRELAQAMGMSPAELGNRLLHSDNFGEHVQPYAGADDKLSAEEMHKVVDNKVFPRKGLDAETIQFLVHNDQPLQEDLDHSKVSDNDHFAHSMNKAVERLATLLNILFETKVEVVYSPEAMDGKWWNASLMRFGDAIFEPFSTGFDIKACYISIWQPKPDTRGNLNPAQKIFAGDPHYCESNW